jgi:hypothetical protein
MLRIENKNKTITSDEGGEMRARELTYRYSARASIFFENPKELLDVAIMAQSKSVLRFFRL